MRKLLDEEQPGYDTLHVGQSLDGRIDPQGQLRGERTQIGPVAARPFQSVG